MNSPGTRTYREAIKYLQNNKISNIVYALILVVLIHGNIQNRDTVIYRPPMMEGEIKYATNQANSALKIGWGSMVASIVGNINPKTEEALTIELKKIISKKIASKFFALLETHVEALRLKESEEIFNIIDSDYIAEMDLIWVYGEKEHISKKTGRSEPTPWTYEIKIGINNGIPDVYDFSQYEGAPQIGKRIQEHNQKISEKTKPGTNKQDAQERQNDLEGNV